ncbi:MAG: GSU2403 family nucleotidyltransferase fold protein [Thiotrichaceae bacterium]
MNYQKLNLEQIKVLTNATQLFESLESHRQQFSSVNGSMHWKMINQKQYLYRAYSYGKNKSLGVKNKETEEIKHQFHTNRQTYKAHESSLTQQVKLHAAYIKANQLNHFPVTAARVIRALQQKGIPHRVIGTNSLYVYEVIAGVVFKPEIIATDDIDILMDAKQGIKIVSRLKEVTLLSLLQKTDKTFQKLSSSTFEFTAANDKGYQVDFITQGDDSITELNTFEEMLQQDDLHPVSIDSLKWYISSPHYDAVVFDTQGFPLRVQTVDPRAFVLHKWFTSQQIDRSNLKRSRDALQAKIMAVVLKNELSHLAASIALEKVFPEEVQQQAINDLDQFSL